MKIKHKYNSQATKWLDIGSSIFMVILIMITGQVVKEKMTLEGNVYLIIIAISLLAEKFSFKGQKKTGEKSHIGLRYTLFVFWWLLICLPLIEHSYYPRNSWIVTSMGLVIAITGTIIRAVGITTLGKYFSAHIEIWDNQRIVEEGIYKYIRHPAYSGNVMQTIGFPLILNAYFSITISIIVIALFVYRIVLEEKVLIEAFPQYREYMKRTKRIIPGIW